MNIAIFLSDIQNEHTDNSTIVNLDIYFDIFNEKIRNEKENNPMK